MRTKGPATTGPADAGTGQAGWRRWLAGRTLRARLIAGLVALFALASLGVGVVTTVAISGFLLSRLDQQLATAGRILTQSIEHPQDKEQGAGGQPSEPANPCATASQNAGIAAGQAPGTFAAQLENGQLSYACVVTSGKERPGRLTAVRLTRADLAMLTHLPTAGRAHGTNPRTRELSGLGDYRLIAFIGPDGDRNVAGLPMKSVTDTVGQLEMVELIVFGTALVVMAAAGTAWIRLALRPLGRVTATASQVSDLPLEAGEVALPHRVPQADPRTEVGRLGKAFNQMLGHVEASLATRQASEAKLRRFVADASHELRTPLAGIRGYTELALRTGGDLSPDIRTALTRVDAESARMSRLVDDLLLLARLDAGRPLAAEPVDLTRLAVDVTSDARVAGPGHPWVLDVPEEPVVVTGDQHRLHQVLANLLGNARTHTPRGTTVTVRITRTAAAGREEAVLSVHDDGPGIPAGVREHIWERFARGDTARSRTAGSTGLGLAIVRAVVTAHDGRLELASEPRSTTFLISLPVPAWPADSAG
ncbi:MAG TPA: HAMP domain-containing sensor histidine kinase [Streptosporangiaceae bacterium]